MKKHQHNGVVRPLNPVEQAKYDVRNDPAVVAAREAERLAELAARAAKRQAMIDNLPSRQAIRNAITNAFPDASQRNVMLKMADVLYWLARDKEE